MQTTGKRTLAIFLTVVLLLCAAPLNGFVGLELPAWLDFGTKASALDSTGQCGENVYWSFDKSTGTLTINGKGEMDSYDRYAYHSPFYRNGGIKSVIIKSGVTSIGDSAFESCSKLTSVTIPDSVTSIGWYAFYNCSFTSVTIGNNVTYIGGFAFYGCAKLTSLTIGSKVTNMDFHVFAFCKELKNVTIANGVTRIGNSAFCGCINLTNITIPNSVSSIGAYAFSESGLTNITIPNSVNSIEEGAFYSCERLKSINISNSITNFGDQVFAFCYALTNVSIPKGVKSIGKSLFSSCKSLTNISIPNSVTEIGEMAFGGCNSLGNIIIPDSVTCIERYAFFSCEGLASVSIPKSVTNIGEEAFGYYNSGYEGIKKVPNFRIMCYKDSAAQQYASENDIDYILIDENPENYMVTYNYSYNGGTSATKITASVAEGSTIDLTPTATKSGWTFLGWNTNASATAKLSSLTMGSSDVMLYAIYKKSLTGTFIDYSGTTKTTRTASTTIYNKATNGTVSAPTQNSYNGWTKRGWTTGTASNASTTSNYTINGDTTYYGLYQRTLTLSYNANGGSSTPSSQTGTQYANSYAIGTYANPSFTLANAISKTGFTFSKWARGSTSGTQYNAGASITISDNTTMYAVWTQNVNIYNLGEETYSFSNYSDSDSPYGHCFGMAVTSSGYYLNILDKSIIGGNNSTSLYSFKDTPAVRKPICHYLQIQGTAANSAERKAMVAGGSMDLHQTVNTKSDWNSCVNYVKNHTYDNKGTLNVGTWYVGGGGHAVNFLYYKEVNGQQRIYIYDNNYPSMETYYYMGSDNYVHEGPSQVDNILVRGIDLMDVNIYFPLANEYEPYRYIFAYKNEISVEGATMSYMKCGLELSDYVMYEIPEGTKNVSVTPLVDNASFEYADETYSFGEINSKTYGVLKVKSKDSEPEQPTDFTVYNAPGQVKSVSVDDIKLNYKKSATIKPVIDADKGVTYTVKYESSNPKVATVDQNGKVTATKRGSGSATITCTVTDQYGNIVKDTCTVNVSLTFMQKIIVYFLFGWIWY